MKQFGVCKKVPFESKTKAKRAQSLVNHSSGRKMRFYKCPHCGNYHLTKQKQKR